MRSALAILALLAGPAAAEPATDEVLRRSREARGPEEAWAAAKALRMEADYNQNGRESRLVVLRQGRRVRMEATFQGESDVLVYDGERGWWRSREGDGEWEELAGAALATRLQTVDLYLPPRDVWHRFESVETLGPADVDGEPAVRLRGRLAGGEEQEVYVALDGHEVRRWDRTLGPPGEELSVPAFLYDYREVADMTFPHYVEISFGTGMLSVAVEEIEIDPELPANLFEDPTASPGAGSSATDEDMVVRPFAEVELRPFDPERPDGPRLAVLWGDPDGGPSAMLLEIRSGSVPLHLHSSDYHLLLFEGTMKHWAHGEGEADAPPLGPGSYWFQPGRRPHAEACLSDSCLMFVKWEGPRDAWLADAAAGTIAGEVADQSR